MNSDPKAEAVRPSASLLHGKRHLPDGFIIVAVLWILAALATLAAIYAVYVVDTATGFGVHDDRLQAEALVSAALELTAHQLTAAPPERRPSTGKFEFRIGQATAAVEFRSEAARIDLNTAPKELLVGLFAGLGARGNQPEYYADRIIGWRTAPPEGQDAEVSAYQTAGLRYVPRGGNFPHVGELSLVMGLPAALVERVRPFVTVYSGKAQIDILAAAPEVIAALPGMTPDRLHEFLAQRQAAPKNAQLLLSLLGPAQPMGTVEASRATRVAVRIAFDNGRRLSSEVVIALYPDDSAPFHVLSWRDELDEPIFDPPPKATAR